MKVLLLGDCANVAANLTKGLKRRSIQTDYFQKSLEHPDIPNDKLQKQYDIILLSYPFHLWKLLALHKLDYDKLVLLWHGSDARLWYRRWWLKTWLRRTADASVLSTADLSMWIPEGTWIGQAIDTDVFKPMKQIKKKKEVLLWGKGYLSPNLPHSQVPVFLNEYKKAKVVPSWGGFHFITVSLLEALACGLEVEGHEEKDRGWVIKNYGIDVVTDRLVRVFERLG